MPLGSVDELLQVSAGTAFSVALRADGSVWSWGSNAQAQLGRTPVGGSGPLPGVVPNFSLVDNTWLLADTDTDCV